jgi:molybdate transport system substrate-binding protein
VKVAVALVTMSALAACGAETRAPPPIRVAAASDLTLAFEELGRAFAGATGEQVTFSFGSTGLLAQQLRQGAPFDLFAAANVSFVNEVVAAGACEGATKTPYARGRIAAWTRLASVAPPTTVEDLAEGRFTRLAIANPEHAPYGLAAKEAFESSGVWSSIESRLVYGENIRQALQFAESGNVEVAIVALALVIQDRTNPWLLIPEELHRPLDQALVVCGRGARRDGGEAFARFVGSETGRAVMRAYGFLLPGETPEGER